mgnify:CR=1 FL=1
MVARWWRGGGEQRMSLRRPPLLASSGARSPCVRERKRQRRNKPVAWAAGPRAPAAPVRSVCVVPVATLAWLCGCGAMPLIVTHVSLLVDQYGAGSRARGAWPAPHNNTDTRACTTEKRRGGEEERGEGEYDTTITLHDRVHENKRYRKYNTTALRSYYTKPNHTMRPRKAASLQQMVTAAVQMTSRSR